MRFLSRFNMLRAVRDFREYLGHRSKHELWFGFASVLLTGGILTALQLDSRVTPEYKREIIYVENWRLDRTDAEIMAQQKIDQAAKKKRDAELEAWRENRKAQFKKIDDGLKSWGL